MFFRLWMTLLVFLILSGCMKTAEKIVVPVSPPPIVGIELKGPYDAEIPKEYRDKLRAVEARDQTVPYLFLAVAEHFEALGEEAKSLHFLDRANDAFASRSDLSGEALALSRKAILLINVGRDAEALALIAEGREKWKDAPLRAFPEYLEGRLALVRSDFSRSRELLGKSLRDNANFRIGVNFLCLRRDTELAAGTAEILSAHLPRLLAPYRQEQASGTAMPGSEEGVAHLSRSLALNSELRQTEIGPLIPAGDFQRVEAEALMFRGLDEGMKGQATESLGHLVRSVVLSRAAGFRKGEIRGLLFMAELGLLGINKTEGLRAADTIRERSDYYHAAPYRIWARILLARYEQEQGQKGEAIDALREAEAILASQRSLLEAEMLAGVCRSQRRAVYEFLVELLASEGQAAEALKEAEKAKALVMVDLLAGEDVGGSPAERELLGQERELGEKIRGLQRRLLLVSAGAPTTSFLERLNAAEEDYRSLRGRFARENPKLLSLIAVRGTEAAALQGLLDENTTLFDYFSTDRSLYVWAIHRETVHLERIDITRTQLRDFVFSHLSAIHGKSKRRMEALSRKAYDLLLKPVIPFVTGDRIGFIPDDCLNYFPFGAMNYRGKFLVDGFSIFQLPWAGLLGDVVAKEVPSGMRILALGDPELEEDEKADLHHAVEGLERIQKRMEQTTVLLHEDASEAKAAQMMAGYDILHFAVRGKYDPDAPLGSGLLLSPGAGQDGTLSVLEIFRLRYPGRAVVLSGCDTMPEKDPEALGFTALQWAFIHAGSSSVVSSLWLVDDRAASRLMELFYRQLARKKSPADALRTAQLRLLREGSTPHVWAAFVLTGRY